MKRASPRRALSNRRQKKTTVYVDEEVLPAAKVYAARKDIRDSEVIETALREYLGLDGLQAVWDRNRDLDPNEADRLAYAETHRHPPRAPSQARVIHAAGRG